MHGGRGHGGRWEDGRRVTFFRLSQAYRQVQGLLSPLRSEKGDCYFCDCKCSATWTLVSGDFLLMKVVRWKTQAGNLGKEVEKHLWLANWFKISSFACARVLHVIQPSSLSFTGRVSKTSADNSHLIALLRFWLNCSKDPYPQVVSCYFCCLILSMEYRRNVFDECGQGWNYRPKYKKSLQTVFFHKKKKAGCWSMGEISTFIQCWWTCQLRQCLKLKLSEFIICTTVDDKFHF